MPLDTNKKFKSQPIYIHFMNEDICGRASRVLFGSFV